MLQKTDEGNDCGRTTAAKIQNVSSRHFVPRSKRFVFQIRLSSGDVRSHRALASHTDILRGTSRVPAWERVTNP